MSNNIVPFNPQGQAPQALQRHLAQIGGLQPSAMAQGVGAGYANVSIKGKVFAIRYNGQITHLVDQQTKAPLQFFDVVIVDAKAELSKTYYAGAFQDGDNAAPDCSSEDGLHPVAPPGKQVMAANCQVCPNNVFGSRVSTDGRASNSKACQDTRKLAIVPAFNLQNENFGGAMLLRVPPDSLKAAAQYARQLEAQGATTYAVVTRIMFDYTVAHPKLTFQALRWLDDQELDQIVAMQGIGNAAEIVRGQAPQQQAALPPPSQPIPGQAPSAMQQPAQGAPVATSAPVQGYQAPAAAFQQPQQNYAPQQVPQQAPQQPPQQQPTFSPPQQPAAYQQPAMQAPGVPANPTSVAQSFPQTAPQQVPMQQAPQQPVYQQPPQQAYAPPAQQPMMQPVHTQPAPVQQAYQQPLMQAPGQPMAQPVQQGYAQPQQTQAPPAQGGPIPQGVLGEIDNML
jgi:hypothetical protein